VLPGLATARLLVARGHELTLWMGGREVESLSAHGWTGPIVQVRAAGFEKGLSFRSVPAALRLLGSCVVSYRRMRADRPDVLLAMGSYASVGPAVAARLLRIPVVLHEANAVPGRAVSLLSRFASAAGVVFESVRTHLHRVPVTVTGLPLREDLISTGRIDGLDPGRFTILVMGGSQGAHALNEKVPSALAELQRSGASFQVIHLAGAKDEATVRSAYEVAGVEHHVCGFLQDIGRAYASATIAVCRAGAGTCAELAAVGLPALLVPLPAARRDHQLANARELEAVGGVDIALERDLDTAWLVNYLKKIMADHSRLDKMKAALKNFAVENAAEKLADLVESTAC